MSRAGPIYWDDFEPCVSCGGPARVKGNIWLGGLNCPLNCYCMTNSSNNLLFATLLCCVLCLCSFMFCYTSTLLTATIWKYWWLNSVGTNFNTFSLAGPLLAVPLVCFAHEMERIGFIVRRIWREYNQKLIEVSKLTNTNRLLTISIRNEKKRLGELSKWSPKRKCIDLLSNSLWKNSWRKCMEISLGNLYEDILGGGGAWRVNLIWWQLNYELNPEAFEVCIPLSDYEQASVVQKLEGVIHGINHYPVDKY